MERQEPNTGKKMYESRGGILWAVRGDTPRRDQMYREWLDMDSHHLWLVASLFMVVYRALCGCSCPASGLERMDDIMCMGAYFRDTAVFYNLHSFNGLECVFIWRQHPFRLAEQTVKGVTQANNNLLKRLQSAADIPCAL